MYATACLFTLQMGLAQDKEQPPQGGEPKDFKIPEKQVVDYDNGLKLVMIPYGAIPKATINVVIKTGNIHESANEVWLSDMMGDLMQEGSTTMSAKDIANTMAGMGGNLNVGVGPHTTTLSTNVLYEFAPEALDIIADVLLNPAWPEAEMDRLKNDMKRNIQVSMQRAQTQARRDFMSALYPDHPYGRMFPTEEMIDGYTVDQVKSFYNNNMGAQRTTIYVAGKFDNDAVQAKVEALFANWAKGPEDSYPVAEPAANASVQLIDRPGAPQSTIYYGLPVVSPSHPDFTALNITNSLLGGSFGSRITSNIREDKGYTYSPRSVLGTNYQTGLWYEAADVTTDFTGASLEEIKKEIVRLQNEPPSQEELEGIQNYTAGIFVLQNSTPAGIIGQLNYLDIHDLPESDLTERVKNFYAVTPEKVQEMTQKYITPDNMTLIVVGDKAKIEQQIKDFTEPVKKANID